MRRLRFDAAINPSTRHPRPSDDAEVTFLSMPVIRQRGSFDGSELREVGDLHSGYMAFQDGDVLVTKITLCFENVKGT